MRKNVVAIVAGMIGAMLLLWLALTLTPDRTDGAAVLGVHFAPAYAAHLGLDPVTVYTALLDDLGVREVRLGAYWPDMEPGDGQYHFAQLDAMLDAAAAHDARVILAIGRRLPRWPECHVPQWAMSLPQDVRQARLEEFMRVVVERYRHHSALRMWQVENEPFFRLFGECEPTSRAAMEREVSLVRLLDDDHPVLITDSGELSFWIRASRMGDVFGTTLYRVVWNRFVGYWFYDHLFPPAFYRVKAWLAGVPRERVIITELQAEPLIPNGMLTATPLAEQRRSMDAARFRRHLAFARATGFREAYLWGAEYWYWLKTQGDATMWDAAREAFRDARVDR